MTNIAVFERRSAWAVLYALATKDRMMIRELLAIVDAGQKAVYTALKGFIEIGLIHEEREPYHNRRWLRLTERGRQVIAKLREIEAIIQQDES
ncbi:MAG: hypothetical protein ACFFCO_09120 [Promethearchaeota archaeon]